MSRSSSYYVVDIGEDAVDFSTKQDAITEAREMAETRAKTALVYHSDGNRTSWVYGAWPDADGTHQTTNRAEIERKHTSREERYLRSQLGGEIHRWATEPRSFYRAYLAALILIAADAGAAVEFQVARLARARSQQRESVARKLLAQVERAAPERMTAYGKAFTHAQRTSAHGSGFGDEPAHADKRSRRADSPAALTHIFAPGSTTRTLCGEAADANTQEPSTVRDFDTSTVTCQVCRRRLDEEDVEFYGTRMKVSPQQIAGYVRRATGKTVPWRDEDSDWWSRLSNADVSAIVGLMRKDYERRAAIRPAR